MVLEYSKTVRRKNMLIKYKKSSTRLITLKRLKLPDRWLRCKTCFKAFPVLQIRLCSILFRLFVFMSYWTEGDALTQRCFVKKVYLEIPQNSQATGLRPATLLKQRLWHRCFPVNFEKSLATSLLKEHFRWLLLQKCIQNLIKNSRWSFLRK